MIVLSDRLVHDSEQCRHRKGLIDFLNRYGRGWQLIHNQEQSVQRPDCLPSHHRGIFLILLLGYMLASVYSSSAAVMEHILVQDDLKEGHQCSLEVGYTSIYKMLKLHRSKIARSNKSLRNQQLETKL